MSELSDEQVDAELWGEKPELSVHGVTSEGDPVVTRLWNCQRCGAMVEERFRGFHDDWHNRT